MPRHIDSWAQRSFHHAVSSLPKKSDSLIKYTASKVAIFFMGVWGAILETFSLGAARLNLKFLERKVRRMDNPEASKVYEYTHKIFRALSLPPLSEAQKKTLKKIEVIKKMFPKVAADYEKKFYKLLSTPELKKDHTHYLPKKNAAEFVQFFQVDGKLLSLKEATTPQQRQALIKQAIKEFAIDVPRMDLKIFTKKGELEIPKIKKAETQEEFSERVEAFAEQLFEEFKNDYIEQGLTDLGAEELAAAALCAIQQKGITDAIVDMIVKSSYNSQKIDGVVRKLGTFTQRVTFFNGKLSVSNKQSYDFCDKDAEGNASVPMELEIDLVMTKEGKLTSSYTVKDVDSVNFENQLQKQLIAFMKDEGTFFQNYKKLEEMKSLKEVSEPEYEFFKEMMGFNQLSPKDIKFLERLESFKLVDESLSQRYLKFFIYIHFAPQFKKGEKQIALEDPQFLTAYSQGEKWNYQAITSLEKSDETNAASLRELLKKEAIRTLARDEARQSSKIIIGEEEFQFSVDTGIDQALLYCKMIFDKFVEHYKSQGIDEKKSEELAATAIMTISQASQQPALEKMTDMERSVSANVVPGSASKNPYRNNVKLVKGELSVTQENICSIKNLLSHPPLEIPINVYFETSMNKEGVVTCAYTAREVDSAIFNDLQTWLFIDKLPDLLKKLNSLYKQGKLTKENIDLFFKSYGEERFYSSFDTGFQSSEKKEPQDLLASITCEKEDLGGLSPEKIASLRKDPFALGCYKLSLADLLDVQDQTVKERLENKVKNEILDYVKSDFPRDRVSIFYGEDRAIYTGEPLLTRKEVEVKIIAPMIEIYEINGMDKETAYKKVLTDLFALTQNGGKQCVGPKYQSESERLNTICGLDQDSVGEFGITGNGEPSAKKLFITKRVNGSLERKISFIDRSNMKFLPSSRADFLFTENSQKLNHLLELDVQITMGQDEEAHVLVKKHIEPSTPPPSPTEE